MIKESQILSSFNKLIDEFIERSSFFHFWTPGKVDAAVSKSFLISFDALVKSFPALIAAGASRMTDEASRVALAVNLYQESGEGDLNRTHHAIYRKFLSTARIDLSTITENGFAAEWREALANYLQNAGTGAVLGALAAGEFLAQPALGRIYPVLKAHYPKADQEYFTKHLTLETEHVEEITRIIARQAEAEGGLGGVTEGFKFGLNVWGTYFNCLADYLTQKPATASPGGNPA